MSEGLLVVGLDEVGYGPTLGPLVVGAAIFELAPGAREADLDGLLRRKRDDGGLLVADSKTLWTGPSTMGRLETSTLGHAVLARGQLPVRLRALLQHAVEEPAGQVAVLPWYGEELLDTRLPRRASADEILERAERQRGLLAERGARFVDFLLLAVPEGRYNQLTRGAGNKAWTLFFAAGCLLEHVVRRWPGRELVIHVDHHGGRVHYEQLLQGLFPMLPLRVVKETRHLSEYEVGRVRIDFHVRADGRRAAVALASIVAKTTRELFMERLNAHFAGRVPGLRPTAGYAVDARRFLHEVGPTLQGGEREQLVRCW